VASSSDRDAGDGLPWRPTGDGVALSVRLQPKSSRDAIDGFELRSDGLTSLKARVRALPEKGEANKALIRLLAKSLGFARGELDVVAGAKDRNKTVLIAGDPEDIVARLEERLAGYVEDGNAR